ncbi:hypothetical protein EDD18DRAFT_1154570 [Armillaria luteobubalina]|uniref:Secreted protein n=1 Tax=Armillaria luteobubalina TaxID=153913 RepID=A0AA39UVA9_9AGAR|nr:hypothetical protein EDD18DRAFT_1154570 [Armillaria luteobubalina]
MCKLYFMVGLYVSEVALGFLPTMSFASSSSSAFSQSFGRGIIACFFCASEHGHWPRHVEVYLEHSPIQAPWVADLYQD